MGSCLVMISTIGQKDAVQVMFVENDQVIETLATDGANDALHIGVLPG
jgi:hypothetical protein